MPTARRSVRVDHEHHRRPRGGGWCPGAGAPNAIEFLPYSCELPGSPLDATEFGLPALEAVEVVVLLALVIGDPSRGIWARYPVWRTVVGTVSAPVALGMTTREIRIAPGTMTAVVLVCRNVRGWVAPRSSDHTTVSLETPATSLTNGSEVGNGEQWHRVH